MVGSAVSRIGARLCAVIGAHTPGVCLRVNSCLFTKVVSFFYVSDTLRHILCLNVSEMYNMGPLTWDLVCLTVSDRV